MLEVKGNRGRWGLSSDYVRSCVGLVLGEEDGREAIVRDVLLEANKLWGTDQSFVIEESTFHELIENVLIRGGYTDAVREYMARPAEVGDILSEYIFYSKYARPGEDWDRCVDRIGAWLGLGEAVTSLVRGRVVLPSMRAMQYAGPMGVGGHDPIQQHNARLYNCSFTRVNRVKVFGEILYLLLCGCGVGYSVQQHHVAQLPRLVAPSRSSVRHVVIDDSIEGWVAAVTALVQSYVAGSAWVEFSYHCIRDRGAAISSGGLAPGHLPLRDALEAVREVLAGAVRRRLRPIEAHDIICRLAECVLAGGIRRSSLISLFSPDDAEMMYSKVNANSVPWRWMANNSAVLLRGSVTRGVFDNLLALATDLYGEPGFLFVDSLEHGTNPCGEIGLDPEEHGFQMCNLSEVNAARCGGRTEFLEACRAAGAIGARQAEFVSVLGPETQRRLLRDKLLGVSVTGIVDNLDVLDWMTEGAELVREAWPGSARVTCIKPSGTASLLLGCVGSGIHPHHAPRYFRRVRINDQDPATKRFVAQNPHMAIDGCLVFPVQTHGRTLNDVSGVDQVDMVARVYRDWVLPGHRYGPTHNVSATITVGDGERDAVAERVWSLRGSIAALSFAPRGIDKNYANAPREAVVTEDDVRLWNNLVRRYRPVDYTGLGAVDYGAACEGAACSL